MTAPKPKHPRALILRVMTDRGWRVRHLAARMEGDVVRNRALLWHYFLHPTGDIGLGPMMACRIGEPLGLNPDKLLDLDRAREDAT